MESLDLTIFNWSVKLLIFFRQYNPIISFYFVSIVIIIYVLLEFMIKFKLHCFKGYIHMQYVIPKTSASITQDTILKIKMNSF